MDLTKWEGKVAVVTGASGWRKLFFIFFNCEKINLFFY